MKEKVGVYLFKNPFQQIAKSTWMTIVSQKKK